MDEEDGFQPADMEVDLAPGEGKGSDEHVNITNKDDNVDPQPASPEPLECVKVNGDVLLPDSLTLDSAQSESSSVSCLNQSSDQLPCSPEAEEEIQNGDPIPETLHVLEKEDTQDVSNEEEENILKSVPVAEQPLPVSSPKDCFQEDSVLSPQAVDEVSEPQPIIQDVTEIQMKDEEHSPSPSSPEKETSSVLEPEITSEDTDTLADSKMEDDKLSSEPQNTSNESSFEDLSINTDSQHSDYNKDAQVDNPSQDNIPEETPLQLDSMLTSEDVTEDEVHEKSASETEQDISVDEKKLSQDPVLNEVTSNSESKSVVDESMQNLEIEFAEETARSPEGQQLTENYTQNTGEDEVDAEISVSAKHSTDLELEPVDKVIDESMPNNKDEISESVKPEEAIILPIDTVIDDSTPNNTDEKNASKSVTPEDAAIHSTENRLDELHEGNKSPCPVHQTTTAINESDLESGTKLTETNVSPVSEINSKSEQCLKDTVNKSEDDKIENVSSIDNSTTEMDISCTSPVVDENSSDSTVDEVNEIISNNQSELVSKSAKGVNKPKPQQPEEESTSEDASDASLSRTEYAQYLGLQPTVKFKCCKCGDANFASISKLKEHQNLCLKSSRSNTPEVNNSLISPLIPQPQMRITRKVYFCSSCGTYFENWNLYIHMREVHRRYVCLTCLAMFINAEKLALHMSSYHNSALETFSSADDFLSAYPTSCFLTCCTCERVFSEQDNFYNHECGERASSGKRGCAMCGLQFAHLQDCPHSTSSPKSKFSSNSSIPSVSGSNKQQESNQQNSTRKPSNAESSPKSGQLAKKIQKQVYVESDGKLNASSVCEIGISVAQKKTQLKFKHSPLKIKLGPLSKTKNKKSLSEVMNSSSNVVLDENISENSDTDGKTKEVNNEDCPAPLQNGEKSPSASIETATEPSESQTPDVSDAVMQSPPAVKNDETETLDSETHQKDSVSLPTEKETNNADSELKAEIETPEEPSHENENQHNSEECAPVLSEDEESPMEIDDSKDVDGDDDDGWHIDEQSPRDEATESPVLVEAEPPVPEEEELQLAGEDAPIIELILEGNLEEIRIQVILKRAVLEACNYAHCVYCTHANKIAVNGKQLAIHLLSEHRYQLVVNSEKLSLEKFIDIVKEKMSDLEVSYFNCDSYDNFDKDAQSVYVKSYECFQCRYITKVHKDLYLHNRKMHQKNSLVCIMCKSNFYSYSELLCHLCPGVYMVANQPLFRCCFCPVDNLPSAFRFMVHVRKVHQACDVCLEVTGNQQKLSNHVWKHKLLHFCYRCGIAYRNKPDITKHLFWKHGTESVVCKRCLHKKWPYVYHFCVPPSSFTCEECNATFSRAVALKVHKRLHTNELLYPCQECSDSFISQKLLLRHDRTVHNPPPPEEVPPEPEGPPSPQIDVIGREHEDEPQEIEKPEEIEKVEPEQSEKKKVDVYDLPPLNLSSESEDESDTEEKKKPDEKVVSSSLKSPKEQILTNGEIEQSSPQPEAPPQIVDSVWENFKDYKSSKPNEEPVPSSSSTAAQLPSVEVLESIRLDHDYFGCGGANDDQEGDNAPNKSPAAEVPEVVAEIPPVEDPNLSVEHNYCTNNSTDKVEEEVITPKKKQKSPKKRHKSGDSSSSDSDSSSSGSDSSSCSCGTNCSCSSSSSSSGSGSSSSDSSDSDSSCAEKKAARKARKKERSKARKQTAAEAPTLNGHGEASEEFNVEDVAGPPILLFHESDLDTNESETDEDFYDEHPRRLMPARNLLLLSAAADSLSASQPTPPPSEPILNNGLVSQEEPTVTKQAKSKKRKRSISTSRNKPKIVLHDTLYSPETITPPIKKLKVARPLAPLSFPSTPQYDYSSAEFKGGSGSEADVRLSKRKRVPKKFYGDSSDEEGSGFSAPPTPYTPTFTPLPPPPPVYIPPPPLPQKQQPKKKVKIETENVPARSPTEADMKLQAILDYVAAGYDGRTADDDNYKPRPSRIPPPVPAPAPPRAHPKLIINIGNHINRIRPEQEENSSSSEESDGDNDADQEEDEEEDEPVVSAPSFPPIYLKPPGFPPRQESGSAKLYCYCHCPYDEVSEMIACDGKNCAIEWFHFECVGITVPPKGKWYCPDCRKRYNIAEPVPNPQYFYNPSSEYMMSSADPSQF